MNAPNPSGDACRLCDENKDKMYSIFCKNTQGLQILHLIKECLPLIIYRTDPLSKHVCEECFSKLETFYKFKKTSLDTADKHKKHLQSTRDGGNKRVQLYLGCEDTEMNEVNIPTHSSIGTSTDDLTISCLNCKSTCFDSSTINSEVELCAELHKAITDSLSVNKLVTSSESEKVLRSRRRKSQAFYHELDDSLCSSLTEFTNTESSQCYEEYHTDVESYDSDNEDLNRAKRRKLNDSVVSKDKAKRELDVQTLREIYKDETEARYFPLSLMTLALNVVNKRLVPGHEPYDFYQKVVEPQCTYCNLQFKNSKLLALHEVEHINIELGEKVDNPIPWHESRDDAHVRNKWLNSYDEVEEPEPGDFMEVEPPTAGDSLLIPVGTEITQEEEQITSDILLVMAKPTVHGIPLAEYSKEERKSFYKSMKVGGVNKKFCPLCRYSFKDNWAIESHYFSLACYYTCRYCGMRFNKQRHRFDEHVKEHEEQGDPLSTKIYAASKLNNFVPREIQPDKVKKSSEMPQPVVKVKTFPRKSLQSSGIKIKEEKLDSDDEKPPPTLSKAPQAAPKTTNQAYFCRKCYKVFFKLDEFNIHSKNCDYNQFPQGRTKFAPPSSNGEVVSPTGRPMRHCVRETTYKDDESRESPTQTFVCFICNTPFPTIYSRNSHMRIHKGETTAPTKPTMTTRTRQSLNNETTYPNYIKREPLEPEIQIHESEQNNYKNDSIGAVSITPISKNPNQKATINPNIMKLVQNNPHLTIRANRSPERQPAPSASNANNASDLDNKSYKCSSCWEPFSNKSHLYFHKKNQCEGSKYPCPFCKKRFGTEAAYSSHIFYSHPE
ncbi:uncharacterized protein LOC103314829 [Tribolium castaneum]|uniref:Uncharacterized protein n=1 Tax=Tribolium castaneum TaxID=7070 RepID=D6WFR5_TRICA|nr:PREDICTED: uncharacterized protein LOC103314829 [Tribolium castaneum]EEZ99574.1 hypothetical protein TcasGA2_TC001560 [Tribolium castaneum]|eukprot:XP_008200075.1 PREDICTED: uncharacterized protein LOC103314829 [Tribolium castaneum]